MYIDIIPHATSNLWGSLPLGVLFGKSFDIYREKSFKYLFVKHHCMHDIFCYLYNLVVQPSNDETWVSSTHDLTKGKETAFNLKALNLLQRWKLFLKLIFLRVCSFLSLKDDSISITDQNAQNPSFTNAFFLSPVCVSCPFVSNSLQHHGLQPTRHVCPWDSSGKNTGVGCYFLLPGIFPTQGSKQVSRIAGRHFTLWATREGYYQFTPFKS